MLVKVVRKHVITIYPLIHTCMQSRYVEVYMSCIIHGAIRRAIYCTKSCVNDVLN